MNDPVNHPAHYTFSPIEVLDAIEAWELPFGLGQVVKYIARAGRKDPGTLVQDLEKAAFYLNRYIEQRKPRHDTPFDNQLPTLRG